MSQEVIIKKSDSNYLALIPHLGVLEQAASLEEAYDKAMKKSETVKSQFSNLGLEHLLPKAQEHIVYRLNNRKTLKIYFVSLFILISSIALVGLTLKRSIDRATYSLNQSLFKDDPERVEKNREKFRALLTKYKPLIEEWKKATQE